MSTQQQNNPMGEFGEHAKEFAAKAAEGFRELGSNVVEASKGFVANAKLNNEKQQKQKELDAAYKKLGELAYQSGSLTGDMKDVADQIRGLYEQLQQIEMEINKDKK